MAITIEHRCQACKNPVKLDGDTLVFVTGTIIEDKGKLVIKPTPKKVFTALCPVCTEQMLGILAGKEEVKDVALPAS